MRIESGNTDEAVRDELASRLTHTRLERNLTQAQLATQAGIGRATLQRLEAGQSADLATFIRVLRVLGLLEGLDLLVPEPAPSPIERLKLQGRQRRRARAKRSGPSGPAPEPWRWADERAPVTS
jgi:transcriptional regulator with XRE-family HTH domain